MLTKLYIITMKPVLEKPVRFAPVALFTAAAVGAIALVLSYLAPETVLGIEADKAAFSLFWIAAALGLTGLGLLPASVAPSAMTLGEKRALVSLAVTVFAGTWLFLALQSIGWDADPRDRRLARVVVQIVVLVIISRVLLGILRRRELGQTVEDERDAALRQRAASVGYHTLALLLVIFAVTIGYSLAPWYPLSPLAISHTAIGILLFSEAARYTAEAWLYRRDRT
jgi:uncharacterized membrane protein YgdD (TMEM256/DUF423 family)